MTEIIAAIIGGFLAASTGWYLQYQSEKTRLLRARHLLTTAIRDDLQHTLTIFDRLEDEWDKTKTVWFASLNELRESRQTYQNNKDWVTVFEDGELRKRVFKYYSKTSDIISNLEYQQRRKYELMDKFNNLVRDIKYRTPSLSDQDARNSAISFMQEEDTEFRRLEDSLPEMLKKIVGPKQEAKELSVILGSYK